MKRTWCRLCAGLLLLGCLSGCNLKKGPSEDEKVCQTGRNEKYLILINKDHPTMESYDLGNSDIYLLSAAENVDSGWKSPSKKDTVMKLEGKTNRALSAMFRAMRADGISDVYVTSAYRDSKTQEGLFNTYFQNEKGRISQDAIYYFGESYIETNYYDNEIYELTEEDAEKVANFYSAKAGYSEHQSGLCVDLITSGMKTLTRDFDQSEAFAWLKENAHRFGFILRYPQEKESVTGYSYEPWHYRFVGSEIATEIHEAGITLEEYLTAE